MKEKMIIDLDTIKHPEERNNGTNFLFRSFLKSKDGDRLDKTTQVPAIKLCIPWPESALYPPRLIPPGRYQQCNANKNNI